MVDFTRILDELKNYDGKELCFMEVCGTHTAAIAENGIPSLLSPGIRLISGPGCPVCVTVAGYIDRLIELSVEPGTVIVSFGDMMKVRGSQKSLGEAVCDGGRVQMVYSPFEVLDMARQNPDTKYVFAAVGFETTTPIYAMLLDEAIRQNIGNVRILSALKTMPAVIDRICADKDRRIDGFIAPGHVSVITGSKIYESLAAKYNLPFVVAGFEARQLMMAIYTLMKLNHRPVVKNMYPRAVSYEGNNKAKELVKKYFEVSDAAWRGLGIIPCSGLVLRSEYNKYDAGSSGLYEDKIADGKCCCAQVITGKIMPTQCPNYGTECTPQNPQGACMVSAEGACHNYYINIRG